MSLYTYVTVDVFTGTRFGGNPLAVVLDATGLDSGTMQQIAAEFNYSETTFVLPPKNPANTAQVRIFTSSTEVPFAGHPNVGTSYVLAREGTLFGKPVTDSLRFEEAAGLVSIDILRENNQVVGGRIRAPRPPQIGELFAAESIAPLVSLTAADISTRNHLPVEASVGLQFICVEVNTLEALGRANPNPGAFAGFENTSNRSRETPLMIYLYTRDTGETGLLRARMFPSLDLVAEDPATGSAAGALAGLLASLDPGDDEVKTWQIDQGVELGRPSRIDVAAHLISGNVDHVTVAGRCIPVMRGQLEVD